MSLKIPHKKTLKLGKGTHLLQRKKVTVSTFFASIIVFSLASGPQLNKLNKSENHNKKI